MGSYGLPLVFKLNHPDDRYVHRRYAAFDDRGIGHNSGTSRYAGRVMVLWVCCNSPACQYLAFPLQSQENHFPVYSTISMYSVATGMGSFIYSTLSVQVLIRYCRGQQNASRSLINSPMVRT